MNKSLAALAAASCLAAVVGCSHDQEGTSGGNASSSSMPSGMSSGTRSVEGNPGATTGPSVGYDRSDPSHYHPLTDDTHQARPADPTAVQPNH